MSAGHEVWCWGSNFYPLGFGCDTNTNGEYHGENRSIRIDFGDDFIPKIGGMGIGSNHACFVSSNGKMRCFGMNEFGQLGYGDNSNRGGCYSNISALSDIDFGTDFVIEEFQITGDHGCVLSTKEELKCWGLGSDGQLG